MADLAYKYRRLTAERLKHLLDYDQSTGEFTCRVARGNQMRKGTPAGHTHIHGYVHIYLDGYMYRGHILAWFWVTGEWPPNDIDHINGKRGDNRFENLRLATRTENLRNSRMRIDNKSGAKGVSWHSQRKKWTARIRTGDRYLFLGLFTTVDEAAAAYKQAAEKYFGEFAKPVRRL